MNMDLQTLAERILDEAIGPALRNDTGSGVSPEQERDMGGSGGEHEIQWGDVTDLVKEGMAKAMEMAVEDAMKKVGIQATEAESDMKTSSEWKEVHDAMEDAGAKIAGLMQKMFREGKLTVRGVSA